MNEARQSVRLCILAACRGEEKKWQRIIHCSAFYFLQTYRIILADKPKCPWQDNIILLKVIDSVLFTGVPILGGAKKPEQIALVQQWG